MTHLELLVGSAAFWRRAAADMASARRRLFVQAMTFEGDAAGQGVAAAIAASPAVDRRVLVDDYSRHMISDRWVHGARNAALKAEVAATHRMFGDLAAGGVAVRRTNPVGALFQWYPARNHKKLIVADDVAYLGGINFADHNFAWHDVMLRLDGAEAADILADDFIATFEGRPTAWRRPLDGLTLIGLDGRTNAAGFADILALIDGARRAICVISPYLTFPFTGALARAQVRGVAVQLITPLANNKPMVRDALLADARAAGFDIRLLPRMSHLKGLVIDDARLIVGSANFDCVSLAAEEELIAVIEHPAAIADFRRLIVEPALAEALPADAFRPSPWAAAMGRAGLGVASFAAGLARGAPRRAVEW